MTDKRALLDRFAKDFMGLDRTDPVHTLSGGMTDARRVYLDTTATALMPRMLWDALGEYFEAAQANSHTYAHRAGRDTTEAIEASRDAIGRLVGYCSEHDVVLFTANGATGATNFLARALFPPELRPVIKRFPSDPPEPFVKALRDALGEHGNDAIDELQKRPIVVSTAMEHHSNLLPWFEAVGHHNVRAVQVRDDGTLDMNDLASILASEGPRVRLVAVTGTSNVTGIGNPIRDIARMAHEVGAEFMVDGAQWVPHAEVRMHTDDPREAIDYLVLSGHKMYAPGSRGALIGKLSTLSGRQCVTDVGGGMVEYVALDDFAIKDEVTAREEAGTPNIPGTIAMGIVAEVMMGIGMDVLADAEHALTEKLLDRLTAIPSVRVYGETDMNKVNRAGVVAFNVVGLHHGLVSAYLNDFHNIAVRNECFCAQPYVKELLECDADDEAHHRADIMCGDRRQLPGMVRASLGVYSTEDDIETLGQALEALDRDRDDILGRYEADMDGTHRLKDAEPLPTTFDVKKSVARWLEG